MAETQVMGNRKLTRAEYLSSKIMPSSQNAAERWIAADHILGTMVRFSYWQESLFTPRGRLHIAACEDRQEQVFVALE